jgi:hypothetical protein
VTGRTKARPGAGKYVDVARREAPAVSGDGYGHHRFASFGAPLPFRGDCSLTGSLGLRGETMNQVTILVCAIASLLERTRGEAMNRGTWGAKFDKVMNGLKSYYAKAA